VDLECICRYLVFIMGDPNSSIDDHHTAAGMIASWRSKEAIPILIEALSDKRVFDPQLRGPNNDSSSRTISLNVGTKCIKTLLEIQTEVDATGTFSVPGR